jgi:hypothetical protein
VVAGRRLFPSAGRRSPTLWWLFPGGRSRWGRRRERFADAGHHAFTPRGQTRVQIAHERGGIERAGGDVGGGGDGAAGGAAGGGAGGGEGNLPADPSW